MRLPRTLLVMMLTALAAAPIAHADVPADKTLYQDGPSGRYLMDGPWLFHTDPTNQGISQGFAKQATTDGWTPVTVPNAWNATDESQASFRGTQAWYRKDFEL